MNEVKMLSRKEIMERTPFENSLKGDVDTAFMVVLLDIRDLLIQLVGEKKNE